MNALPIYKYLIEYFDEQTLKTYAFEAGNFDVVRLHGGETYKLNGANVADYWRQWEQETGHTSEDSTDICVVWREGFNIENFFTTGKAANVQTVSPTTWTGDDIEKFFSSTARQLKAKLKITFDSIIRVNTAQGQRFLVSTLDKPYPSSGKTKSSTKLPIVNSKPSKPGKPEPLARKKLLATPEEIATAWKELNQKHTTT